MKFVKKLLLVSYLPIIFSCSNNNNQIWTLSNNSISISVDQRMGGAVTSIKYNNIEIVNSFDMGRGLQGDIRDSRGECFNPTEAGSETDYFSSSRILDIEINNGILTTQSQIAFWLAPGSTATKNCFPATTKTLTTSIDSNEIMRKEISLGAFNYSNIISLNRSLNVVDTMNSPSGYEINTIYMNNDFHIFYIYDVSTQTFILQPKPIYYNPAANYNVIAIVASNENGSVALGEWLYTPTTNEWVGFRSDPDGYTEGQTLINAMAFVNYIYNPSGWYTYQTYFFVGSLNDVKNMMLNVVQ